LGYSSPLPVSLLVEVYSSLFSLFYTVLASFEQFLLILWALCRGLSSGETRNIGEYPGITRNNGEKEASLRSYTRGFVKKCRNLSELLVSPLLVSSHHPGTSSRTFINPNPGAGVEPVSA